jgi:hypothetical protein
MLGTRLLALTREELVVWPPLGYVLHEKAGASQGPNVVRIRSQPDTLALSPILPCLASESEG